MDSTSRPSTSQSRRPRKSRQLVVPADTLLNFARYHPRNDVDQAPTRTTKRQMTPRRPEQFVQANYRFAVDPYYEPGYADCVSLPDAIIPWSSVDLVFMHHSHNCPICLHRLRCPRVTPCGHVFDFVCMLQHLSHTADGDGYAKCPLCFSRVCADDLRACALHDVSSIEVGSSCSMRLVSRERGHIIPHAHPTKCYRCIPQAISRDVPLFSRLCFADENYLLQLTADSMQHLRQMKQEDQTLAPFVQTAMEILKKNKYAYRARRSARHRNTTEQGHHCQSSVICENTTPTGRHPWYFYQVKDSRNVFLHPVNHRCIVTEFSGDFNRVNSEICGEILQIERYTMTEHLRKRYRFLEHLPIGCEFCFVELDLSHIMSEETQAAHIEELTERSYARRRRQIASAREDRLMERKHSELLREYFTSQSGYVMESIPVEVVDSRDARNFPALRVHPSSSEVDQGSKANTTATSQRAAQTTSRTIKAWGAEVSSYCSVTSNMGLFPSLKQTTSLSSSTVGSSDVSLSHLDNSDSCLRSDSTLAPRASRQLFSSPLESRTGRKTQGRTTILVSNQGSPYRR